jgi:hypothetical protein
MIVPVQKKTTVPTVAASVPMQKPGLVPTTPSLPILTAPSVPLKGSYSHGIPPIPGAGK